GGLLLMNTEEKTFRSMLPYLILGATLVTALQEPMKAWIAKRGVRAKSGLITAVGVGAILLAGVYGGYFIARPSIIVIGILGLIVDESFTKLNAVKQVISLSANLTATIFFAFTHEVLWVVALIMAIAAFAGGAIGGKFAGRIKPSVLRWIVVAAGAAIGIAY